MNVKGIAGDSSEGNEECVIGTWKGEPSYTVAGSLAELCPPVVWKAELINDQLGYLADEISSKMLKMQFVFSFCL